ncbi:hypothetical protein DVS28_b0194 (plasmid) [Euzebya pacifica]|uniref:site-specific DNA-methyltransferase (adenine-specific) n=1 Tax=Euzebya pacifica TaxID=1608957 RepID=A0A346Y667_9ACTN|nr:hypothetical protein [Euzebya pacifica]AXV09964.1 hypothetical protein DVS28_b0194 [Euzebya pacifica]
MTDLLPDLYDRERAWTDPAKHGISPRAQWSGNGKNALWVCHATANKRPANGHVIDVWRQRQGNGAAPVLLVITHHGGAVLCGPSGDSPPVVDFDADVARRIATTALELPTRHAAARKVFGYLDTDGEEATGIINRGLFATHHLRTGVPDRPDWDDARTTAEPAMDKVDRELVAALGWTIEPQGVHEVLRDPDDQTARAVAVFLAPDESADVASVKRNNTSPVSWAMTHADRNNIPWVVTVQDRAIRLYSTATSGAAGQGSRETTYAELDLTILPGELAGYLTLLFSADALAPGGTAEQIREASADYAAALAERLRERVYDQVIPALATAIAAKDSGPEGPDLDAAYRTALTVLFRLLFLGYAESKRLLPYKRNTDYTDASLAKQARRLADLHNEGADLGFDNPLTPQIEAPTDTDQTDLWDTCARLFRVVDKGHTRYGVPVYNGGLFSDDPDVNPAGATIADLALSNTEFGPPLMALLIDHTPDGGAGPIDFRSLSVREFGTIYEGLLESELALADQDLTLVKRGNDQVYEPAGAMDEVVVAEGEVYLHNASGARKASGSYFTKPFAVEHLIGTALLPTLDEHLDRIADLLGQGQEADAAEQLFDFRVADIAMGSGHFLTAAVDEIHARISAWLADHPIAGVDIEIDNLRRAARQSLPEGQHDLVEDAALLRRLIARRCVYGVDLNPISVELARVSMWIHTFVPGLPLSFLDHNLAIGNSLTGVASLDEALDALSPRAEGAADGKTMLTASLGMDVLRSHLAAAEQPLSRLGQILDTTTSDIEESRLLAHEAAAAIAPLERLLDAVVAARLGETPMPNILVESDVLDAGSDQASTAAAEVDALHFPIAFPEVFIRDRAGFDVLIGNPPWQEATIERHGFWALRFPGLRSLDQAKMEAEIDALARSRPDLVAGYEQEVSDMEAIRATLHAGPYPGMETGDPDLYKAFAWRFWHLLRLGGRTGVVLPRGAIAMLGSQAWRQELLDHGALEQIVQLTNKGGWVFDGVEPRYTVAFNVLRRNPLGTVTDLRLYGPYDNRMDYDTGIAGPGAVVPTDELRKWTQAASVPLMASERHAEVFRVLRRHRKVAELPFAYIRELDATNDKKHMILNPGATTGLWEVWKGSSFDIWQPGTGEVYAYADPAYMTEVLEKKRTRSRNMKIMPPAWRTDPDTLPVLNYRIAFRDIARATDSRTMRACLIPPEKPLTNKAPYLLRSDKATVQDEAYLLGVLCTRVFDWQARCTVETNVNKYVLDDFAVPWPTNPDHPGRRRVVEIATRLAAQTPDYTEWAKPLGHEPEPVSAADTAELLVELDATVARLYGLTRDDLTHLYATFHPTGGHEAFGQKVIAHFDTLDFGSAHPTDKVTA